MSASSLYGVDWKYDLKQMRSYFICGYQFSTWISENLRFRDTEISCQWSYQYNRKIIRNCISEIINNEINENVCSLRLKILRISLKILFREVEYLKMGLISWKGCPPIHLFTYFIYQYRRGLSMAFCLFIRCKMCIIKLSFINKIGVEWVGVSKLYRPL